MTELYRYKELNQFREFIILLLCKSIKIVFFFFFSFWIENYPSISEIRMMKKRKNESLRSLQSKNFIAEQKMLGKRCQFMQMQIAILDFISRLFFRTKMRKIRHDRTTLKLDALHWLTHIQITTYQTMFTNLFHLCHFHRSLWLGQPVIIVSEYTHTHKHQTIAIAFDPNARMRTTNIKVLNWHYERYACSLNVNASFVGEFETNYYRCICVKTALQIIIISNGSSIEALSASCNLSHN